MNPIRPAFEARKAAIAAASPVAEDEILGGMVGAEGFEPPALCSQSRCATRLRYAPTSTVDCIANPIAGSNSNRPSLIG